MKDRLEEFVREHRQDFDSFEPSDALWDNLEKQLNKSKRVKLKYYLSRAAVVAAIFSSSFMVQQYFYAKRNNAQEIPELKEAEMYYTGLIDAKLEEIKPKLAEYPEIEHEMESDLSDLDSVYNSLKDDLKDNVANQEVIEAMIENYRMRIDILEDMLHFLDRTSDDNNNENNSEYEL